MATTLENIYGIGPTVRVYKWDLSFTRLPAGAPIGAPGREVHLRCLSTDIPSKAGQDISVQLHGHTMYEPGIYAPTGALNLQVVETIDMRMTRLIDFLKQVVWQNNTAIQQDMQAGGAGGDQSFEFIIRHLDNQDNPLDGYKLKRCFWNTSQMGQLSGGTSDVLRPTLAIVYTDFEVVS